MKVSFSYLAALCIIFFFSIFSNTVSGRNHESNRNFNDTENAARAIRKLLSGEIESIKLENGDEIKIGSNDNINDMDYKGNNNTYSFISNYEVESDKNSSLRKKERSEETKNNIIQDKEDFFILDDENIDNIARSFVLENKFDPSEIKTLEQSLKNIIKSLNN